MAENIETTPITEEQIEDIKEKSAEEIAAEELKKARFNERVLKSVNDYIVAYYVKNDELPDLDRLNKLANALY